MTVDSTTAKFKVTISGQEIELSGEDLVDKFGQLQRQAEVLVKERTNVQKQAGILRAIQQDPREAIRIISEQHGLKPENSSAPKQRYGNDGFSDEDETDEDDAAMRAELAELRKKVDTMDMRTAMTADIDRAARGAELDPTKLRQFMIDQNMSNADQAVRVMQADALIAERQAADAEKAEADAAAAAEKEQADAIAAMLSSEDGVSPFNVPSELGEGFRGEDGALDTGALIRSAMAQHGATMT